MNIRYLPLGSLFLAIAITGCAAEQKRPASTAYKTAQVASSSASNSTQMEQVSKDHTRWVSDALKSGKYKHMMIDPVVMKPMPSNLTTDQQALLNRLFIAFDQILLTEMSQRVSVVTTPGADVARLRPTITGATSSAQGMKAYEVIPIAAIFGGIKAATGTRAKEIEVSLDVKLVDSQSNEIVASMKRKGTADQALSLIHI
ncbi:MAG: DUF3313 domain-containing protein [Gammaproteobacteria bacterium]|nr:DUF3313 domain-containing protein [Gammaproteobacteria bacterium]